MEQRVKYLLLGIVLAVSSTAFSAKQPAVPASAQVTTAFDRVVDRVLARETENTKALRAYSPLVETYLQNMQPDKELGLVPYADQYFLTRVGFQKSLESYSFHPEPGFMSRIFHNVKKEMKTEFISQGFSWMMMMDMRGMDGAHYTF